MKKIAIIPLRSGSKGIVGKNRKKILGRPLFTWILTEAIFSDLDEIYVYTDDPIVIEYVSSEYIWSSKVKVMRRSSESATDTASTEFAMDEFSKKINYDFDILCLLQATSPLTSRENINEALAKVEFEKFDSCLSVVEYKRFFWNENGFSLNYNYKDRPRRQDFDGTLVENGAVYVTTKEQFIRSGNRLGGNIGILKMPEDTLIEIDEPIDLLITESLIKYRLKSLKGKPSLIKALVLDVDGVFTNGNITYSTEGEFSKNYNMQDGMGLELLREHHMPVVVITSENSEIVTKRMEKLKVDNVYLGVKDKYSLLEKLSIDMGIERKYIAYIGDDLNDLSNICSVGWGICPNNALLDVKINSDLILNSSGGNKAIREAVSFILNYNNRFNGGLQDE